MIRKRPIIQLKAWSFSKNRRPLVGVARSRTLSMNPESRGSTRDACRGHSAAMPLRAAPTTNRRLFVGVVSGLHCIPNNHA